MNGGTQRKLVHEVVGNETYEYYPLGDYIVAAPEVCGGQPMFKYTQFEATGALNLLVAGYTIEQIAQRFAVSMKAIKEVVQEPQLAISREKF